MTTTAAPTKSNTDYVKGFWYFRNMKVMQDLIDEHSEGIDSLNPHKIYTQYCSTEDWSGCRLWYKVGRRYVCIYSATHSYDSFNYGNPQDSFDIKSVLLTFPTDKDGYSVPLCSETLTKAQVVYGGCKLEKLIDC